MRRRGSHRNPDRAAPATVDAPAAAGGKTRSLLPGVADTGRGGMYKLQFAALYGLMGIVFAGCVVGLYVLFFQANTNIGVGGNEEWSDWKPKSGGVAAMTKEIADHVAAGYRLNTEGNQLVAVLSTPMTIVPQGTTKVSLLGIFVRKAPQTDEDIRVIDLSQEPSRMYQMCGLGPNCSITGGQPSVNRGRLVRREALELALYTFKFVDSIDSIVAFMPPPPGEAASTVLFLEKADLKEQLSQPLSKTLPLGKAPLPNEANPREAATIDKLTLKKTFTFSLAGLQGGGVGFVLDPQS
jgi:hypothetical protein